jgi:hypothetical protein
MGLDEFTSDDVSSTDTKQSNSAVETNYNNNSDLTLDDTGPVMTVVMCRERDSISVYTGKSAFPSSSRHKNEKIVSIVESQRVMDRLDSLSKEIHGCSLEKLFKRNYVLGKDFIERVSGQKKHKVECEVCDEFINTTEDKYTTVSGNIVHFNHTVLEVARHIDLE